MLHTSGRSSKGNSALCFRDVGDALSTPRKIDWPVSHCPEAVVAKFTDLPRNRPAHSYMYVQHNRHMHDNTHAIFFRCTGALL